jgi:hypothetical protein
MNDITSTIIVLTIAGISAIVAISTIVKLYLKAKHPKKVTVTKPNGERITVSTSYNREDSKRWLEFIND